MSKFITMFQGTMPPTAAFFDTEAAAIEHAIKIADTDKRIVVLQVLGNTSSIRTVSSEFLRQED